MRITQWALNILLMAKNARNLPRINRLEPRTEHSRRPARTERPIDTYRSRETNSPLREVGLSTRLHSNDKAFNSLFFLLLGRESLIRSIASNDVTIILGETGSGKTTRMSQCPLPLRFWLMVLLIELPQYLLEGGSYHGQIAVTQPRRVAATSLATRVSAEQGYALGTLVGYSVRFDERVGPGTRIKYLTDGMLVREMMNDPLLTCYDVVIVDEAHERTLRTDIVLASLKRILALRNGNGVDSRAKGKAKANPLKVVIMSATLDAEKFSKFFERFVLRNF